MVYFEFWVELVFGLEGNSGENGQNWPFLFYPTPLHLGVLRLGGPEPGFLHFLVHLDVACSGKRTSPLRLGVPVSSILVHIFR